MLTPWLAFAAALAAAEPLPQARWEAAIEVASGRGERGPWRQNESRFDFVDDPAVAIDDRGEAAVAWVDQARKDVLLQRYAADGTPRFARPVNVSRTPEVFSWLPRVHFAPGDSAQVFVLWQEIVFSGGSHGGDIFFARSGDGGATFAAPINLSRSPAGDGKGRIDRDRWHNGSLDLAVAADGTIHAAWTEYEGVLWTSRSTDGGRSFTAPLRVAAGTSRPARGPSIAAGPGGKVLLAWTVGEDDAADIRVARSEDGGASFGAARIVAETRGYSDAPKAAFDPSGTVHLAWDECDGGPFGPRLVVYARSTDAGDSFTRPRVVSRSGRIEQAGAGYASLAMDARGGLYLAWEIFGGRGERPRGLAFTYSRDGGRSFAPPGPIPGAADERGGANGSTQGLLMRKLAASPDGKLAVVNSSMRPGEASRVVLLRGRVPP